MYSSEAYLEPSPSLMVRVKKVNFFKTIVKNVTFPGLTRKINYFYFLE